jgi:hypothetical protein
MLSVVLRIARGLRWAKTREGSAEGLERDILHLGIFLLKDNSKKRKKEKGRKEGREGGR